MLDATVCDIYLINDTGSLVGRPILTACVDTYSGLCCGYSLSWEGGVYSLRGLMLNIIADKVSWCNRFGISIHREDWDCNTLPATFITDMGSEYTSENFEQIAELGVTVVNLPSYRPELKGLIEKIGYVEGMPVVTDPGIIKPMDFIHEVIDQRFPNPFMPDTPSALPRTPARKSTSASARPSKPTPSALVWTRRR